MIPFILGNEICRPKIFQWITFDKQVYYVPPKSFEIKIKQNKNVKTKKRQYNVICVEKFQSQQKMKQKKQSLQKNIIKFNSNKIQSSKSLMYGEPQKCPTFLSKFIYNLLNFTFSQAKKVLQKHLSYDLELSTYIKLYNFTLQIKLQLQFRESRYNQLQQKYIQTTKTIQQKYNEAFCNYLQNNDKQNTPNIFFDKIIQLLKINQFNKANQLYQKIYDKQQKKIVQKIISESYLCFYLQGLKNKNDYKYKKLDAVSQNVQDIITYFQQIQQNVQNLNQALSYNLNKYINYQEIINNLQQNLELLQNAKNNKFYSISNKLIQIIKSIKAQNKTQNQVNKQIITNHEILKLLKKISSKYPILNSQYFKFNQKINLQTLQQILQKLLSQINYFFIKTKQLKAITKLNFTKQQLQVKFKKTTISLFNEKQKYLSGQLNQITEKLPQQLKKIQNLNQNIQQFKNKIKEFEEDMNIKNNQAINFRDKIQKMQNSSKNVFMSILKNQKVYSYLQNHHQQNSNQNIIKIKNFIKQSQSEEQIKDYTSYEKSTLQFFQTFLNQIYKQIQNKKILQQKNIKLSDQNKKYIQQQKNLQNEKLILQNSQSQLKLLIDTLQNDRNDYLINFLKIKQQKDQIQKQFKIIQQQLTSEKQKSNISTKKIQQLEGLISKQQQANQNAFYQHLYQVNAFNSSKTIVASQMKQLFIQKIENQTKQKISRMNLLYKMDKFNKASLYNYIDSKENILVCIKTQKGVVLGGYTNTAFRKQIQYKQKQESFLFKYNNKEHDFKLYKLLQGKKSICYDSSYIIFGSSQLRLDFANHKLSSNFGITKACFENNNKQSIQDFLQEGKAIRQAKIECYEIYQLQFQSSKEQIVGQIERKSQNINYKIKIDKLLKTQSNNNNKKSKEQLQNQLDLKILLSQTINQNQKLNHKLKSIEQCLNLQKLKYQNKIQNLNLDKDMNEEEINRLNQQIQNIKKIIISQQQKVSELEGRNYQKSYQIQNLNNKKQQIQKQLKYKNRELELLKDKINKMTNNRQKQFELSIQNLQDQIKQLKSKINLITKTNQSQSKIIQLKSKQNKIKLQSIKILQQKEKVLQQELKTFQQRISAQELINIKLFNKIKQLEKILIQNQQLFKNEIVSNKLKISEISETLNQYTKKYQLKQKQQIKLINQKQQLTKAFIKIQRQNKQSLIKFYNQKKILENKIYQLNNQITILNKNIKQKKQLKEKQIKNLEQDLQMIKKRHDQLKIINKQFQKKNNENQQEIYKLLQTVKHLQQMNNKQYNIMISSIPNNIEIQEFDKHLRNKSILDTQRNIKFKLLKHIQLFNNSKKIYKTNILFKRDFHNRNILHKYIDGYSNLLLIIKTRKGLFGLFSQQALKPKDPIRGRGFIFCFTNGMNRIFRQKYQQKSILMMFDNQNFIAGNEQIIFRNRDNQVMIKVGKQDCHFNTESISVREIYGEQGQPNGGTDIVDFQFYEIKFQGQIQIEQNKSKIKQQYMIKK